MTLLAFFSIGLASCGSGVGAGDGAGDGAAPLLSPTIRVSVHTDSTEGDGDSATSSTSSDGRYVAFDSHATNLVDGDTNGLRDVFVRDTETDTTTRISGGAGVLQGDGISVTPAISSDGRYVAFRSDATNLVFGDTNGQADIFRYDRQEGTTIRVSVNSDGEQTACCGDHFPSYFPSISDDGRYVAFRSNAEDLVEDDWNGARDVFVRDTVGNVTTRVSVATGNVEADYGGDHPSISGNGKYVAFESDATNLVDGDINERSDVFVHDRDTGVTTRISVRPDATEVFDGRSGLPSISDDGKYVAFFCMSDDLVDGDENGRSDIVIHDRDTGVNTLVSVASDGTQSETSSDNPSISGDGRYVAFASASDTLQPDGAVNTGAGIFVRDTQASATYRINVAADGEVGNRHSSQPSISSDGRYISYWSTDTNLVDYDTNERWDVFRSPNLRHKPGGR